MTSPLFSALGLSSLPPPSFLLSPRHSSLLSSPLPVSFRSPSPSSRLSFPLDLLLPLPLPSSPSTFPLLFLRFLALLPSPSPSPIEGARLACPLRLPGSSCPSLSLPFSPSSFRSPLVSASSCPVLCWSDRSPSLSRPPSRRPLLPLRFPLPLLPSPSPSSFPLSFPVHPLLPSPPLALSLSLSLLPHSLSSSLSPLLASLSSGFPLPLPSFPSHVLTVPVLTSPSSSPSPSLVRSTLLRLISSPSLSLPLLRLSPHPSPSVCSARPQHPISPASPLLPIVTLPRVLSLPLLPSLSLDPCPSLPSRPSLFLHPSSLFRSSVSPSSPISSPSASSLSVASGILLGNDIHDVGTSVALEKGRRPLPLSPLGKFGSLNPSSLHSCFATTNFDTELHRLRYRNIRGSRPHNSTTVIITRGSENGANRRVDNNC
ncbi:hypothetical protein C7M84_022902 [Penaeus vannamei]|uniref:Uncharacterized protein n=1 Tax=Penaeus vannamei TaxID=6689 RepID=A0A423U5C4_PENVA|nr:hypothetical protein C7M84_022902 [Penaeus vannamei]